MLKALSVRQPWAWLIVHAGKNIENRRWKSKYRGGLLIHAPDGMTRKEYDHAALWLEEKNLAISLPEYSSLVRGAILGECTVTDWVSASSSPWFVGSYGAILSERKAYLEPVPCKGKLGIWEIPKEIYPLIMQQRQENER